MDVILDNVKGKFGHGGGLWKLESGEFYRQPWGGGGTQEMGGGVAVI